MFALIDCCVPRFVVDKLAIDNRRLALGHYCITLVDIVELTIMLNNVAHQCVKSQ